MKARWTLAFGLITVAFAGIAQAKDGGSIVANPHDLLKKRQVLGESAQKVEDLYQDALSPLMRGRNNPSEEIATYASELSDKKDSRGLDNIGFSIPVEVVNVEATDDQYTLPSLKQLRDARGQIDGPIVVPAPKRVKLHSVWKLVKNDLGSPVLQHRKDDGHVIPIRAGMVIGGLGRVVAVKDTVTTYSVLFKDGTRIDGFHDRFSEKMKLNLDESYAEIQDQHLPGEISR
jgi:hypothetical protein